MVFWIIIYILIAILTMFILLRTTTESSVSNEDSLILGILWPISYISLFNLLLCMLHLLQKVI